MTDTMTLEEYKKELKKSALERLFDAEWERHTKGIGIEQPKSEQKLVPDRQWLCDRVWVTSRVIVEIDGGQFAANGGRHNTDEDRDKINVLTLYGWRVLRYSGTMLKTDPEGVIKQIVGAVLGIKPDRIKRLTLPTTPKPKQCDTPRRTRRKETTRK